MAAHEDDALTQAILKAFDFERTVEDPYLSPKNAMETLADHWDIDVEEDGVAERMDRLAEQDVLFKKPLGKDGIFRPLVGPALSAQTSETSEQRQASPPEEFVALDTDQGEIHLHPAAEAWLDERDAETTQLVRDELAAAADDPVERLKPLVKQGTEKLKLGRSDYRAELRWDRDTGELFVLQFGTREAFYK